MLRNLLREPLTHFLAIAIAVFVLHDLVASPDHAEVDRIVVTSAKVEQLTGLFTKTWQRAPSTEELKGLIDEHVKEEIYYREALLIGLDKDDPVIRRRLRQKMEFLSEAESGALTPTDAELETYLRARPDKFRVEPMLAFEQIYFDPGKRDDRLANDAQRIVDKLRASPGTDTTSLGDQTLLPSSMPLVSVSTINGTFGDTFANELAKLNHDRWAGPISSSYGVHLVRVTERKEGGSPTLSEARDAVVREWTNEKRRVLEQQRLDALLKRYSVTIEMTPELPQ